MEHMKTDEVPNHLDSPRPSENSCCLECMHYNEEINVCSAFFPKKIPQKYLSGEEMHTTVDDDQFLDLVYTFDISKITL